MRRAFVGWIQGVLKTAKPEIHNVGDLLELRSMLHETVKQWPKQWLARGREEGREEGRRQGELEIVARQLELKFGPLDALGHERLEHADLETLRLWGERLLEAPTLADVWGG